MLNKAITDYKEHGIRFNKIRIRNEFNAYKKTVEKENPWLVRVNAHAVSNDSMDRIGKAFDNFFKKNAKFPKYRKKKSSVCSFSLPGSEIEYDHENKKVLIRKIGWLKLAESVRFEYTRLYRITVKNRAGKWFVSFTLEIDNRVCENQTKLIAIDLGVSKAATCSDGYVLENLRILAAHAARLRKLNKELSRRKLGSKNWWKTVYQMRKCYEKITNIRDNYIHHFTTKITRKYGIVCLEDLNVKGMVKNHKLAKHILDVSFGEIRRQFNYKALEVRYVDRFFPSSKKCCCCGSIKDMPLNERMYICPVCGIEVERDMSAALTIRNECASNGKASAAYRSQSLWTAQQNKPIAKSALAPDTTSEVKQTHG
jgi:putative transposase